jgi:hypothetical protein
VDSSILNRLSLQLFPELFEKDLDPNDQTLDCAKVVYLEYGKIQRKASSLSAVQRQKITHFVKALGKEREKDNVKDQERNAPAC